MKDIKIGLIGFGTVGSGVYDVVKENAGIIAGRTGFSPIIKTICDLNTELIKKTAPDVVITDKWEEVTSDPDIDVIVELIGGITPARKIIISALNSGKAVVTANKKLLAEDGAEIFETAGKTGNYLGFEASVAGGIPCLLALTKGLVANNVKSVIGILNGTTNYILSKMQDQGLPFAVALADAQEKGFAEADPTFDIEGFDAGHKISILSMLAYGKAVDYKSISIEGITRISEIDIAFAKDMGYIIKLLGVSNMIDGKIDIRVHPAMIPVTHPLASVRNEFNAVMYDCDMTGPVTFYGRGAGGRPTASAILSDVIQAAVYKGIDQKAFTTSIKAEYLKPGSRFLNYYMRIHSEDSPGILSKISGVLGNYNISIASVIQKAAAGKHVPLIIVTHEAQEEAMMKAVKEIENFEFVTGDVTLIRVED
jgi:homoserine dehydrogenase